MNPLLLALMLIGGAFVLVSVRILSRCRATRPPGGGWTPAKQIIFEAQQERNQKIATYTMTVGLFILWGSVIFIALPHFNGNDAARALESKTSVRIAGCEEKCGDGICAAFSCIQEGCACAESYKTCAKDCPAPPDA